MHFQMKLLVYSLRTIELCYQKRVHSDDGGGVPAARRFSWVSHSAARTPSTAVDSDGPKLVRRSAAEALESWGVIHHPRQYFHKTPQNRVRVV